MIIKKNLETYFCLFVLLILQIILLLFHSSNKLEITIIIIIIKHTSIIKGNNFTIFEKLFDIFSLKKNIDIKIFIFLPNKFFLIIHSS